MPDPQPKKRVEFPLPPDFELSIQKCRSCGAAVVWIETAAGKPMPLDWKSARFDGETRVAESHFAHCKQAASWRKPK